MSIIAAVAVTARATVNMKMGMMTATKTSLQVGLGNQTRNLVPTHLAQQPSLKMVKMVMIVSTVICQKRCKQVLQ